MKFTTRSIGRLSLAAAAALLALLSPTPAHAQFNREPGKSIGTVTTHGNLIVLTLSEDAPPQIDFHRLTPGGTLIREQD